MTTALVEAARNWPAAAERTARQRWRTSERWGRLVFALILVSAVTMFAAGPVAALLVVTTSMLAVAVLGVWYPVPGFLAIGILCTLDAVTGPLLQTLGWWRWNTVNYWLLAAAVLAAPLLLRVRDLPTRFLQALLVLSIVELAPSTDRAAGAQLILELFVYWGILAYLLRAPSAASAWYWFGVACGTAGALAGGALVLGGAGAAGWPINPNVWSFTPLTGLFAICLALTRMPVDRQGRMPLYVLAFLNVTWVFLSSSRGTLSLALVCVTYLLVTAGGLRRSVAIGLAGLMLCLAVVSRFPTLGSSTVERVLLLVNRDATMRVRTSGRDELLRGGLRLVGERPLGIGTGGFSDAWTRVAAPGSGLRFRRGEPSSAHSGWVRLLAENGLPGAALFACFVLAVAAAGRDERVGPPRPGPLDTARWRG